VLPFPLPIHIADSSLSAGAATIGSTLADAPTEMRLTPPQEIKVKNNELSASKSQRFDVANTKLAIKQDGWSVPPPLHPFNPFPPDPSY
jgi:hypothetical protein